MACKLLRGKSISGQVIVLAGLFILSLIGFAAVQHYVTLRENYLQELTENARVKVELGYIARAIVQELHFQTHELLDYRNAQVIGKIKTGIRRNLTRLKNLLDTIEHGGTYVYQYRINFNGKQQVSRKLTYHNYYPGHFNLGVMEIRPKIAILRDILASLPLPAPETPSPDDDSAFRKEQKTMEPFFQRLQENANRIFLDGQREMVRIRQVQHAVRDSFARRIFWAICFGCMVLFALSEYTVRGIRRIVDAEARTRAELETLNGALEQQVERRTSQLRREITVRRQAEEQQRTQAEFLTTVMDALDHPFYVLDVHSHKVVLHNRAAREINPGNTDYCYSMSHRRQKPCAGTDHPCPIRQVLATRRPVVMEHVHYSREGREIVVEVHGYPIFDDKGNLVQMIEYSLDISKRKQAEKRLAEINSNLEQLVVNRTRSLEREIAEREKFQLVVEQNPSSIIITDVKANIEYVNRQTEKTSGYEREKLLGQNPSLLASERTPRQTYDDLWETLEKGKVWHGEFINKTNKGELYTENVLVAPLHNDQGVITHYVSIKENITELKQAKEEAEAANRAKTEFLSRMSHELRTPLNAINGFSELLLQKNAAHPLHEQQIGQVLKIHAAGRHLLELINEILELSRIESGRLRLSSEPVSVSDSIRDCVALILPLAEKFDVHIQVDEETMAGMPMIRADLTKFKQVLLNLLSNAVKYNHPGGSVTVSCLAQNHRVCIEVTDTGQGISPENMDQLFVAFARLGQENSEIEGTGIGLTITKQLIERMDGSLEVDSTPGKGSSFRVLLPAVEKSRLPESSGQSSTGGDIGRFQEQTTILYVEDNVCNIHLLKGIVAHWTNVFMIIRKTAEKGIEAAVMLKPDLILMDLHLPGMSGREAFLKLRQNPETAHIPVIALSADAMQDTITSCLELGFSSYLTKPFVLHELWREIQNCLHRENRRRP